MMVFSAQYTFCPLSNDICKLRIDFDVMVLSAPEGSMSNAIALGDCNTDTLSVSSPGSTPPPIICGGSHSRTLIRFSSEKSV